MAVLKTKQLREMKIENLERKLRELRLELSKEMANVKMGRPIKNPGKIRVLRRNIARILTFKKQLKLAKGGKK
jgi:large subunit ribosomal protein L29